MPFEKGHTIGLDYNQMYLANQMKELKKGLEIYIYSRARKEELDSLIKNEKLKIEIKTVYREDRKTEIDYWIYVRCFK